MTNHKAIKMLENLRVKIKMRHMCKSMDGECTKEDVQEYKDEFEALLMAEKALKDAPDINVGKWIPCSERLPKCNGCYLVWRPHFFGGEIGMPAICYFDGQDTWHDSYGVDFTRILNEKDVIAWMPLPEPYKESED